MTSAPYFQPSPVRLRLRRDVRYATCSVSTSVGATRPKYRTDGPVEGWDECLQTRKKDSVEAHGRRCPCTERSTDVIFSHHAAFLHLTSSFCPSHPRGFSYPRTFVCVLPFSPFIYSRNRYFQTFFLLSTLFLSITISSVSSQSFSLLSSVLFFRVLLCCCLHLLLPSSSSLCSFFAVSQGAGDTASISRTLSCFLFHRTSLPTTFLLPFHAGEKFNCLKQSSQKEWSQAHVFVVCIFVSTWPPYSSTS